MSALYPNLTLPKLSIYNKISYLNKIYWIKGRIGTGQFLRIFTVAFVLILVPAGGSNPVGHITNAYNVSKLIKKT